MIRPVKRATEASSAAGLGGILALIGLNLPDVLWANISHIVSGVMFVIAYFRKEAGNPD